jgi:hypothetical protein
MLVPATNLPRSTERQSLTEFPLSGILNSVDVTLTMPKTQLDPLKYKS